MKNPKLLAKVLRSEETESLHFGHIVLADNNKMLEFGDSNYSCFVRSCIKPIQAKIAKDILKERLREEFLAIACSSHLAEPEHIDILKKFLAEFSIDPSSLLCGTKSMSRGELQSKLEHNCSGKHLAIIAACKKQGWSFDDYLSPEHPFNQMLTSEIKKLLGSDEIKLGRDDCGLPSFHMSLKNMTKLFLNLSKSSIYREIISTMNKYPILIAGKSQIETLVMSEYPNKFFIKGGAEGLMAISNLETEQALLIKIIDGSNRAKANIVNRALKELNWIEKDLVSEKLLFDSNDKPVGQISSQFKLDFDTV